MKNKKFFKRILSILIVFIVLAIIAVPQFLPAQYPAGATLFGSKQYQIAHRGLSSLYPEQSADAYIAAGESGFYGAECDVHTTSDGKLIIMHDDTVDRTTDGSGPIEDMTLNEILNLNIDTGNGIEKCQNKKVLLFEEYLEICSDYSMVPYIELKKLDTGFLPDLMKLLDEFNMSESAVLISFSKEYLLAARETDKDVSLMLLSGNLKQDDIDFCIENNIGIDFDFLKMIKYSKELREAKEKGIPLAAWTVDMPIVSDFLHFFGVDYITTNRITP